jgi:hypothetical protein
MTRRSHRLAKAVAALVTVLATLSMDAEMAVAASGPGPKRSTNSLTTQFPLGAQKLCCAPGTHRRATSPTRHPSTRASKTSATSSTAPAPPPATRTSSRSPLLGGRRGGSTAALIMVGVLIVGGLAFAQACRVSVRRRVRARRRASASAFEAVAAPGEQSSATVPPRPAPIEQADVPPPDPLAELTREIVARASPAPSAPQDPPAKSALLSRLNQRGAGVYRLGQILYDRGDFDGAAAAWRLAASKRHVGAATKLGMLLERSGDAEGAREAYRDARHLGDPDATERGPGRQ